MIHPVWGAGVRTHDLLIISLLLQPLDQGPNADFKPSDWFKNMTSQSECLKIIVELNLCLKISIGLVLGILLMVVKYFAFNFWRQFRKRNF